MRPSLSETLSRGSPLPAAGKGYIPLGTPRAGASNPHGTLKNC